MITVKKHVSVGRLCGCRVVFRTAVKIHISVGCLFGFREGEGIGLRDSCEKTRIRWVSVWVQDGLQDICEKTRICWVPVRVQGEGGGREEILGTAVINHEPVGCLCGCRMVFKTAVKNHEPVGCL